MDNSKVLVIYTGGTIGMTINEKTGALAPFDFEHIIEELPELKKMKTQIEVVTFEDLIDSSDVRPEDWVELACIIKHEYAKYDGFVILHGTDTMSHSASALSFMLEGLTKPVIFTGSQIPIGILRTDGKENFLTSIEIAGAKDEEGHSIVPEVCVYFQNKLLRGNRTRKYSADYLAAFRSENYPPLADVGIDIHYNYPYINKVDYSVEFNINVNWCSDITVITVFPGLTQKTLAAMLSIEGLKGVVLRTFGSGNVPTQKWFAEEIKKCIDKGAMVINVSQCNNGTVKMSVYDAGKSLLNLGVISGADITSEAAITKLITFLGRDLPIEKLKKCLANSISGELTE